MAFEGTDFSMGTYGAKRQSWRKANPRDVLKRLLEEHPKAKRDRLFELFNNEMFQPENQQLLESVVEYWFANNLHSLQRRDSDVQRVERQRVIQKQVETIKDEIKSKMQRAAKLLLLDMILPNGKKLRNCTGTECAASGGWLARIAERVKPDDAVGKVLSEDQVRKIFDEA